MDRTNGILGTPQRPVCQGSGWPLVGRPVALLLGIFALLGGCGRGTEVDSDVQKPALELSEPVPLPGNHQRLPVVPSGQESQDERSSRDAPSGDQDQPKTIFDSENMRVKPGHWIAIQSDGQSNEEDFDGILQYSMRRGDFAPRLIPGTRYFLRGKRPVSLTKEQPKRFETPLFVVDRSPLNVAPELLTRRGSTVIRGAERFLAMKPHQYHMVVLTEQADNYRFLSVMPSVRNLRLNSALAMDSYFDGTADTLGEDRSLDVRSPFHIDSMYYKLTLAQWDSGVELPENAQQWTSTAYLLWSDFPPQRFNPEQQTALLDWLHFGGQIIVSADALDSLQASFLRDYLPVRPTGAENQSLTQLLPMMEHWSLLRDAQGQLVLPHISPEDTFIRTTWDLHPAAQAMPHTDGLVVERTVGKGRIVATAFPLNMTRLRTWPNLDHWFNSCLLRRPGRDHAADLVDLSGPLSGSSSWDPSESMKQGQPSAFQWTIDGLSPLQASAYTTLEYASRDWRSTFTSLGSDESSGQGEALGSYVPGVDANLRRFGLGDPSRSQGAWDDYSQLARAARASLKEQAGITPPNRDWVLQALLIYLVVLVPVNYTIFRLTRRLEWAWFSIPAIAVVGAFSVVRAASLDIGFSNKRLQVNLIEVPAGYSRAHITGYGSLYSSLTTQFRFASDNSTTLALPFPTANLPEEVNEAAAEYVMEVGRPLKFGPQQVLSHTMEMYHFEQIVDLGGGFRLLGQGAMGGAAGDGAQVQNSSDLNLSDVSLFHHDADTGRIRFAQLSTLPTGQVQPVTWIELSDPHLVPRTWQSTCLADRQFQFHQILTELDRSEADLNALVWPEVVDLLSPQHPELAEALRRMAAGRRLSETARFRTELLMSALVERQSESGLSLGRLFRAVSRFPLGPGEVRLVGWTDDVIDQWQVYPMASQMDQRSLVVAHLVPPRLPDLGFDVNLAYPPRSDRPEFEPGFWEISDPLDGDLDRDLDGDPDSAAGANPN